MPIDTTKPFDITFIGHVCYDEITPFNGTTTVAPGSAVLCGAAVSSRVGARTAVVTRMNPADVDIIEPLRAAGVKIAITPCEVTTFARVVHPSTNVDERRLYVIRDSGPFTMDDIPHDLHSGIIHLAGISNHEFTMPFIQELKQRGYSLSLDMQSFVRVIGPERQIVFSDFPLKREVVALLDVVKLDIVEAELLTGTSDLVRAARIITEWGANEVLITEQAGATLAVNGQVWSAPFTNRSTIGRTGRGDTTMSAYLSRRMTHTPIEALRFAAALVSVKMEKPGPFADTISTVEQRMNDIHALECHYPVIFPSVVQSPA